MSGHTITFEKIILEGFGPYREKTEFIFSEGSNCYVASNEAGKTTMLSGLSAVLFGLSHRQKSSSAFTLERFRNWNNPRNCRGEVFVSTGENRYLFQRDFDSHKVEVWLLDEDFSRKELILEGTHNPEARKPLKRYEELLHEILGISSQELFTDTFSVEQPLPEPQNISTELQGLLSGGKGTPFHKALDTLVEELKTLTKYTGPKDRGITARNMSKEGQLEELTHRITELEQKIESGRTAVDSLVEIQQALQETEEELTQTKKTLSQKEKTHKAWSEWQLLQREYSSAARERNNLKKAETEARSLEKNAEETHSRLEKDYSEFIEAPQNTGDHLQKMVSINSTLNELDKEIRGYEEALKEENKKLEELENDLTKYSGWEWLGKDPVSKISSLRRSTKICREEWHRFQRNWQELSELQDTLKHFAPFAKASEQQLKVASSYDRLLAEKTQRANKAKEAFQSAENSLKNYREEKDRFEKNYKELINLPDDAPEALNDMLEELKKAEKLEKKAEELSQKTSVPIAIRAGSAAILSIIAGLFAGTGNILLLTILIFLGAIVGFWAGGFIYSLTASASRKRLSDLHNELRECRKKIEQYKNKLGRFAEESEIELARVAERFKQYEQEKLRIEEMGREISEDKLNSLREELNEAEKELEDFNQKAAPFCHFEDIQEALNKWRSLSDKKEQLGKQVNALAHEKFGCQAEDAASADPASEETAEHWQETARFLNLIAGEQAIRNVQTMIKYLDNVSENWWQENEEKAADLAALKKQREELAYRLKTHEKQFNEAQKKRQNLQSQKNTIVSAIQKIMKKNDNDAEAALKRWKESQELLKEIEYTRGRIETLVKNYSVEDISGLQELLNRRNDYVLSCLNKWKEHIKNNPGLPNTEEAGDVEQLRKTLEQLEHEINQLVEEKERQEQKRNELTKQQAMLEGENPLNIAAAELELAELQQHKENMEIEADALEIAFNELYQAISEYRSTYKERLEEKASSYCQSISGVLTRAIELDDNFNISIKENGRPCTVEQLSKGARDQLYLAIRFAVADLLAEEIKLPLIFDDPFTSSDSHRLKNIRNILKQQAPLRQFILLSHADYFTSWGKPVTVKNLEKS